MEHVDPSRTIPYTDIALPSLTNDRQLMLLAKRCAPKQERLLAKRTMPKTETAEPCLKKERTEHEDPNDR
jgi:hypothetical protein